MSAGLGQLVHFFLRFRFWVAATVGSLSLFCSQALMNEHHVEKSGQAMSARIVIAATLALYNLDNTLDIDAKDPSLHTRRLAHVIITIASTVWLALELLFWTSWGALAVVIGFSVCALYAVHVVVNGHTLRIKTIPGLKAPFVGWAVGSASVLVPLLGQRGPTAFATAPVSFSLLGPLLASISCLCTANALLFDVPDQHQDQLKGVPTVPVVLGYKRAKLQALAWIACGAVSFAMLPQRIQASLGALLVAFIVATVMVKPTTSKWQLALWVDGALAVPLIIQILAP